MTTFEDDKEKLLERLVSFQNEWHISFPVESFINYAFWETHQDFDKVINWKEFQSISFSNYFDLVDAAHSELNSGNYNYKVVTKIFGCDENKNGTEYNDAPSFLKDAKKYKTLILVFMNLYQDKLYGTNIRAILIPEDFDSYTQFKTTKPSGAFVTNDGFNLSLHKRVWTYIAENYIPIEDAIDEMCIKGEITKEEYYQILNSIAESLACEYKFNKLDEHEVSEYCFDEKTCKKFCPFKITKDSCLDGLDDKIFENYDIRNKQIFVFNKQEWKETALAIANFPVKEYIKTY